MLLARLIPILLLALAAALPAQAGGVAPNPFAANFYERLGVPESASSAEIEAAYRAALELHASPAVRNRLAEAYLALSSPVDRLIYDATLAFERAPEPAPASEPQRALEPPRAAEPPRALEPGNVRTWLLKLKQEVDPDYGSGRSLIQRLLELAEESRGSLGFSVALSKYVRERRDALFGNESSIPEIHRLLGMLSTERDQYFAIEAALERARSPLRAMALVALYVRAKRTGSLYLAEYSTRTEALIELVRPRLFPGAAGPYDLYVSIADSLPGLFSSDMEEYRYLVSFADMARYGSDPREALRVLHHAAKAPVLEGSRPTARPLLRQDLAAHARLRIRAAYSELLNEHPELKAYAKKLDRQARWQSCLRLLRAKPAY